jgi:hypothetical protein
LVSRKLTLASASSFLTDLNNLADQLAHRGPVCGERSARESLIKQGRIRRAEVGDGLQTLQALRRIRIIQPMNDARRYRASPLRPSALWVARFGAIRSRLPSMAAGPFRTAA